MSLKSIKPIFEIFSSKYDLGMSKQGQGQVIHPESISRRSRFEICLDILRAINKGARKPTRIMYAANMSWRPLQKLLASMMSGGFIRKIDAKNNKHSKYYYTITQSGLNVLNYLDKENDLIRLIEITQITLEN